MTDEKFWDDYWASVPIPARLDKTDPATRSLAAAIDELIASRIPSPKGKALVEIGCAPGRWLAHFSESGFSVSGIESAPGAAETTRQNMRSLGIEANIYEVDAFDLPQAAPELLGTFDCVISLGLVEHFEAPEEIFRIHARLAKPGALVIIGVPNYGGLSGAFQRLLDAEWLAHHNTRIMKPDALLAIGTQVGLAPLASKYAGGFDPNLYNWKKRSLPGFAVTRLGKLLRKIPGSDSLQSRHLSSYILAAFLARSSGR